MVRTIKTTWIDTDYEDLLEILLSGTENWNAWREMNPNAAIVLSKANLSKANLSKANLSEADLYEANLSEANLYEANLSGANLYKVNLYKANLSGANLSEANLYEADLYETNLYEANLIEANLYKANLSGADLSSAYFDDASGIDRKLLTDTFKIRVFDPEIDPAHLEQLNQAIAQYAKAAGYAEPEVLREEYGSFFKDVWYKVTKFLTPDVREEVIEEGIDLYRRGSANLKNKLEQPGIESTQQLVNATATILKEIENFDNIILHLGKLVVIKQTHNEKARVVVRTIATEIQHKLESSPELLENSQSLFSFLNTEAPPLKEIETLFQEVINSNGHDPVSPSVASTVTTASHQRLQDQHEPLQAEWETRNQKLKDLRIAFGVAAGAAEKFQLEKDIEAEEVALAQLNERLEKIDQALQSGEPVTSVMA